MNKKHLLASSILFFSFLLVFTTSTISQTPQYYNLNTGTSSNSFPFNVAGGKAVNSIFLAGEFNQPTPLPAGQQITKVYFRAGSVSGTGTRSFTNLHICLAQDTITTLTTAQFYAGTYDTVFAKDTSLTFTAGGWTAVTLTTPFPYDPTKSLIMFVGQCGTSGSGGTVANSTLSGIRRVWSVAGCPFAPFAGGDGGMVNFGVDVEPAVSNTPTHLFYKIENNPTPLSVINCAIPGVGTSPSTVTGLTITPGGQFDSCLTGTGLASGGVTTGWNWNMAASSWSISFWVTIPTTSSGSAYYLFGDPGSGTFRCFHNGVALPNNLVLRGTGITDVTVTGIGPAPTVVTFVYDSIPHDIKAYKNGVLAVTVPQSQLSMLTGTGFKFGGYSTSTSFIGKLDEFRIWKKALTAAEVLDLWDEDLACGIVTGTNNNNSQIPKLYSLEQNYPNPFNPVTKIEFAIPKAGNVKIVVHDVLGREVANIVNEHLSAGSYSVNFNAENLSSGVYFYTLTSGDFITTKKMLLIK